MNSVSAAPPRGRAGPAPHQRAPLAGARAALFRRHLLQVMAVVVTLCGSVVLLNLFVDPLWYWHGNQITGRNFPFNERLARVNLLLQDPAHYDCLLFGSSRVGLFDQSRIENHRCFNVTFSSGSIVEFLDYAGYLVDLGVQPELVIVGVDDYNFLPELKQPPATPDFVRRHEPPPSALLSYLSLGATRLSLLTLLQQSDESRYYDERIVGHVLESAPQFVPPETLPAPAKSSTFDPHRAALYGRLRGYFPDAAFWGYVPPISAWDVAGERYAAGFLDAYLEAIAATAAYFDEFYDFSVPSPMTERTDNSYDGSHYFPWVNAIIAERLQAGGTAVPPDGFGLPVHALTPQAYRAAYMARFRHFLAAEFPAAPVAARRP